MKFKVGDKVRTKKGKLPHRSDICSKSCNECTGFTPDKTLIVLGVIGVDLPHEHNRMREGRIYKCILPGTDNMCGFHPDDLTSIEITDWRKRMEGKNGIS